VKPLRLEEFLLIAEAVLGVPAETVRQATRVAAAESALEAPFASYGGQDFYPEPADRAAILCSRIIRNHPLPDGNKRVGLLCMLMFIAENGWAWVAPSQDELAQTIEWLADRSMTEEAFVAWVRKHVRVP